MASLPTPQVYRHKKGLLGEEHANILPFAEQTVLSLGVERLDFRDSDFAYLRVFATAHPATTLTAINASAAILAMIRHADSAATD